MLKYLKRAYVMSVASYAGIEGGAEVETTQEEVDFQEQVNLAIADGKIDESEILNLQDLYEAEKNNISETFIEARRQEMITIIAQNLVNNNSEGEFENEFEIDADAIQIDGFIDKDTFFNSAYAKNAERFGITSTEVLNTIAKIAPDRVELDTIGNIENGISDSIGTLADKAKESATEVYTGAQEKMVNGSVAVMDTAKKVKEGYKSYQNYINEDVPEFYANKSDEVSDYIADKRDEAIVATAEALDPKAARERLSRTNKKGKETKISQEKPEKTADKTKPLEEKDVNFTNGKDKYLPKSATKKGISTPLSKKDVTLILNNGKYESIKDFQKKNGLDDDGKIGAKTFIALHNKLEK